MNLKGKKNLDKTVQIYFSSCFVLLRYQMSLIYDYILNKSHTWRYVICTFCNKTNKGFCFLYLKTPEVIISRYQPDVKHVLFWPQGAGIHLYQKTSSRLL